MADELRQAKHSNKSLQGKIKRAEDKICFLYRWIAENLAEQMELGPMDATCRLELEDWWGDTYWFRCSRCGKSVPFNGQEIDYSVCPYCKTKVGE